MKEQRFFGEQFIFFSFNERDKVRRILAFVNFLSFEIVKEKVFLVQKLKVNRNSILQM